jgi:serine O-acetyltransferase
VFPPNATAVGVPARIVRLNGVRPANLDQIHIGDPVSQQLCYMGLEIRRLRKELEEYEREDGGSPEKDRSVSAK